MLPERFALLLDRYKNDLLDASETAELKQTIESGLHDALLKDEMLLTLSARGMHDRWTNEMGNEIFKNVLHAKPALVRPLYVRRWKALAIAAAAMFLFFLAGKYLLIKNKPDGNPVIAKTSANDVKPGGNRAMLTLSNGSNILLDSAQNGLLAQQGNSSIQKMKNGQLVYNAQIEKPNEVLLNTLTTPRGGQYELILPDGTAVWLNAASSIQYPVAFAGKERRVTVTGEVYFEVAHDATKPFIVKTNAQEITVLGTHFNINAYDDEADVKTTLLEGSINLKTAGETVLLKPGQQAQLNKSGKVKVIQDEDLEQVMAWRNGYFKLSSAALPDILRQISRWYDVTIVYEGGIPDGHLTGKVLRNMNLSQVVKVITYSGFKVRVEDKKLIVSQ